MRLPVIAFLFVLLLPLPGNCASVKEELQGISREITEKRRLLNKTAREEKKVSGELSRIESNLKKKEESLQSLNRDLKAVEATLERTGGEIETVRGDVERKKEEIQRRLAVGYKAGEVGNVRVLFSSESLPQMAENLRYMGAVVQYDKKKVAEYNARIDRLKELKGSLESAAERKERIKGSIEQKKQEIEEEKKKKASHLASVRQDKKGYQASLRELEANARRLQAMVEKLEAARRKSYTNKVDKQETRGAGVSAGPPLPDTGFGAQKGRLSLPAKGEITGRFGRHKHPEFNSYTISNGISIAASAGADIRSVYEGKVIFAEYFKGYGNMVIVDHGGGFFSLYAHTSKILRKDGAHVAKNEVLASVGDVDSTKGPMLYFEIRYQGRPVDPAPWFR